MGEPLQWAFELLDKVSDPAERIYKKFDKLKESGQRAVEMFESLEHIAEMTGEALRKVTEFGEMAIEAANFKEHALIGLEAITGSAKLAGEVFERASNFARVTGQSAEQMVEISKGFALGGFDPEQIAVLQQAAGDVGVIRGASAMQTFADQLRRVGTLGHATAFQIRALDEAAGIGGRIYQILGAKLGMGEKELRKQLEAGGEVSGGAFIGAALAAVQQIEHGPLGTATARAANEIPRLFDSVLTGLKQVLFEDQDEGELGLLAPLRRALMEFRDMLQPGSPFVAGVQTGIHAFFEGFGVVLGPGGTLDQFLAKLKDGTAFGADFKAQMKDAGATVRDLADSVGALAKALELATWPLRKLAELNHAFGDLTREKDAMQKAEFLQRDIQAKVAQADREQALAKAHPGGGLTAIEDLVGGPVNFGRSSHDDGFEAFADGGIVRRPTLALVGEAGDEAIIPLRKLRGTGGPAAAPSFTAHAEVHLSFGSGVSGKDADEIATRTKEATLNALTAAFEELGIEGGAV